MTNGMEITCSTSIFVSLVGDKSLAPKLRLIAAVEIYLNATYVQNLALKSVYEKRQ